MLRLKTKGKPGGFKKLQNRDSNNSTVAEVKLGERLLRASNSTVFYTTVLYGTALMYANEANISFAAPKNYDPVTMINTELATWLKANKLLQYGGIWPHDSKTCCPARNLKGNACH